MGLKTWLRLKPRKTNRPSRLFDIGPETADRAFLHIGKTGGTGVAELIKALREGGWQTPAKVDHRATLPDLAAAYPKMRLSIILRDPLERIVSGFNSRLRQGRPLKNIVWSTEEAVAFSLFPNVEAFLDAMLSDGEYERSAVAFAMSSIRHLARGYEFYFRDPSYLKEHRDRLYFVGDIRDMRAALAGIFAPVPIEVIDKLYQKIHVASASSSGLLAQYPDDQVHRMRNAVANEYAIYDRLMDLAQPYRHHSSVKVPAIAGGRSTGLERPA